MKLILLLILLLSFKTILSQNLLLNPDFEEYYHLPDLIHEIGDRNQLEPFIVKHWHKIPLTTPDYFHVEAIHPRYGIPDNVLGHHPSYKGNAYVGFVPMSWNGVLEWITGTFSDTLQEGMKYEVSFMYRFLGDHCLLYLDEIEVYISRDKEFRYKSRAFPYYENIITPELKANVIFDEKLINDGEWHKVSGVYIAKGGEKYITLGLFYQDRRFSRLVNEYLIKYSSKDHPEEFNFIRKNQKVIKKNPDYEHDEAIESIKYRSSIYYFIDHVTVTPLYSE